MQRITVITDAWQPQVNGVVRTYENIQRYGWVDILHPSTYEFRKIPLPGYPEIELVLNPWLLRPALDHAVENQYRIHVATEGPLGIYANRYLSKIGYKFSSCFHTHYPKFIKSRLGIPEAVTWPFYRRFHNRADYTFVPSTEIERELQSRGITRTKSWSRGVDTDIFNPDRRRDLGDYILCVSRVSHEKGLDDFCQIQGYKKVLIGDGPYLSHLKCRYKDVEYLGKLSGIELAQWFASARCFVFPSKADTFGIVILEALASGTPVAAYPVAGAQEVIVNGVNGYIGEDLQLSVDKICNTSHDHWKFGDYDGSWEIVYKQLL